MRIETTFDVGDVVYYMYGNVIRKSIITSVNVTKNSNGARIEYESRRGDLGMAIFKTPGEVLEYLVEHVVEE